MIVLPAYAANCELFSFVLNNATAWHSIFLNKKSPFGDFFINENWWWESACINRAENKQEFSDLMQRVKEFKEKWLISPEGEN